MLENAPEGQGLPYLCAKDVHMYNIDFSSLKKMHFSKKEKERYEIKRGDMLVVEGGAAGSSAIVKSDVKDVYIQNSIMITRCNNSKMINDYACYVLNSMILRGYSESICNKATIMHFTKEKLGDTIITVPPIKEQITIVNYLDSVTSKIDEAISQQQKMIDLLNERKQIIIQNAVTKGLDPNAKMKDSGVEWIGEIPEDWELKRFRFIFSENKNKNSKLLEKNQLQFKYGEIVSKDRQDISDDIKKILSNYSVVQEGDIMINGLNLNYDFVSQRVAIVREKGVITSAYISLRAKNGINSKFYNFFMKAMDSHKMFHGMGSGIRLTLAYDNIKNLFFPYPKFSEQTAIANFLDSVTSKIDSSISQCNKMISLLQERKQIIINDVVTGKVKVV